MVPWPPSMAREYTQSWHRDETPRQRTWVDYFVISVKSSEGAASRYRYVEPETEIFAYLPRWQKARR